MVSLWPFKSESDSAASFEKTLSALAGKISRASSKNDALRQQARRLRVGWALYGGFAYILVFIILTVVTGWHNWGRYEYTIIAGGPPVLYLVRQAIVAFYDWRITSTQDYLDGLYKERDATIDKLKKATKYDSTQQLLDKYGSPKSSPKSKGAGAEGKQKSPRGSDGPGSAEQRVFRQPPPTANIRRDPPPGLTSPATPLQQTPGSARPDSPRFSGGPPFAGQSPPGSSHRRQQSSVPSAEFAPNAFGDATFAPAAAAGAQQHRWYDRIMDALLGEDETQARNRIALICRRCRLVNGQAPPGTRSLEELGRWRCSACGAWNGVESEAATLVQRLAADAGDEEGPPLSPVSVVSDAAPVVDVGEEDGVDVADVAVEGDTPAKSTRSRAGGKKG